VCAQDEYELAAYFVDWESTGRIQSIALLNSTNHNFNVIAPSQLLRDFSGGAYLVWRTHGSVRLRVAKVGGDPGGMDACISGLFWG
jgi:hypothetical protein